MDDIQWLGKYTQFPLGTEFFYSDSEDDNDNTGDKDTSNVNVNHSLTLNLTSESAYEGDISNYATNTSLDT